MLPCSEISTNRIFFLNREMLQKKFESFGFVERHLPNVFTFLDQITFLDQT